MLLALACVGGLGLMAAILAAPPDAGSTNPLTYDSGQFRFAASLLGDRHWKIAGSGNSQFTESITIRNVTGKAERAVLDEPVLPPAVLDVASARFTPERPKIANAGLTLEWPLCVPAHGAIKTSYQVTVPDTDLSVYMSVTQNVPGPSSELKSLEARLGQLASAMPSSSARAMPSYLSAVEQTSPAVQSVSVQRSAAC